MVSLQSVSVTIRNVLVPLRSQILGAPIHKIETITFCTETLIKSQRNIEEQGKCIFFFYIVDSMII